MEEVTKINLANGRKYLEGYLNVDNLSMNPNEKADEVADIFTYDNDSFKDKIEEIRLHHFMMYVLPEEAEILFKRWYDWLKEGGILIIETSHAQRIANMIMRDIRL